MPEIAEDKPLGEPKPVVERCIYCSSDRISKKGCVTNCANCGDEYHSCGD